MSPGISTRLLATQSDERLLALVREGHERAFEALVHRYRRPLLGYCRRLPLSGTATEDVVQLSLLKAWIAVREGAEVRDLKAWLYRVVHNTALNAAREGARESQPLMEDGPGRVNGLAGGSHRRAHSPTHPDLDLGLRVREALAEVAALPTLQREVLVRTAVAGHSHERVAGDLGLSDGAVRGLLYRARTTLRRAATVLTPPPLLSWIAGRADQSSPAPERLAELAGGGGTTLGLGGLLLKGGVAAVTAGTVLTGAALVHLNGASHHRSRHRLVAAAPAGARGARGALLPAGPAAQRGPSAGAPRYRRSPAHRGVHGRGGGSGHAGGHGVHALKGSGGRTPGFAQSGGGAHGGPRRSVGSVPATPSPGGAGTGAGPSGTGQSGAAPSPSGGASGGATTTTTEPVGSAASAGSSGTGAEGSGSPSGAPPSGGSGSSGSESSGGGGSGSSGGGSSGSGGSSSGGEASKEASGGGGEEHSGSLVGTVVHEVNTLLEHLLH